jgi:regulation of enolase protein 1 (concanavalin A-like superfamily)
MSKSWIGVGTVDLVHDEDVEFARRSGAAGVPCELVVVSGATHDLDRMFPRADLVEDFRQQQADALRRRASWPTDEEEPMTDIDWDAGEWTNEPARAEVRSDGLHVTAREGSDAWRITSYGFVHDTEHALLVPLGRESAVEVTFHLALSAQFDQAGVFLRVDDSTWIKTGVEWSDGEESLGAVVTRGVSDWSLSPVSGWDGRLVTLRTSRSGDAVTVRARVDDEPWRLVRVAPLDPDASVLAGPFCCAPSRSGLTVHFTSWRSSAPDPSLHPDAPTLS